jgi:hypothetical protein
MIKKHYEKIMGKRYKQTQKVTDTLGKLDVKQEPIYMDASGNIDWAKLAKHVNEATSGR